MLKRGNIFAVKAFLKGREYVKKGKEEVYLMS